MTVGDRIKKARINSGISQTELAIKTKSSKQTIYKYENNIITNIPSDKIEEIAKALNTSPSYLMGWENNVISINNKPHLDSQMTKHIEKLNALNKEHRQTIFDTIDFLYNQEFK